MVRSCVLRRHLCASAKNPTSQMGTKCHVQFHVYAHLCNKYRALLLVQVVGLLAGDLWLLSASGGWHIGTVEYLLEQIN